MTTIDVIYRYDEDIRVAKAPPASPEAAQRRLEDGNVEFAALFEGLTNASSSRSRVVPVDLRDLSFGQNGNKAPMQSPFASILGAQMRAFQSSLSSTMRQLTSCGSCRRQRPWCDTLGS